MSGRDLRLRTKTFIHLDGRATIEFSSSSDFGDLEPKTLDLMKFNSITSIA